MADIKISALPAATTPLAGTEVLPIVQGGVTEKVAVDDLTVRNFRANATTGILQVTGPAAASTRVMTVPDASFTAARTDAAQSFTGDQTLSTGNLVIGTSGKGIDFTQDPNPAGMTSELLDDYEEGTWTPTLDCGTSGTITLNSAFAGTYTKIGRQVTVCVTVYADSVASPVGSLTLNGLPFACNSGNSFNSGVVIYGQNTLVPAGSSLISRILPNATSIQIWAFTAGTVTDAASYVQSTTLFTFTGSYFV
jgi:hypothetical protein